MKILNLGSWGGTQQEGGTQTTTETGNSGSNRFEDEFWGGSGGGDGTDVTTK